MTRIEPRVLLRRDDDRDLEAMRSLATRACRALGPRSGWTAGDVAWWWYGPSSLNEAKVAIWTDGSSDCLAWAWVPMEGRHRGEADLLIDPAAPELRAAVLDWIEAEMRDGNAHSVWAMDRDPFTEVLSARGFVPTDVHYVLTARSLDGIRPSPPARGYRVRQVRGPDEAEARAAVHAAAFAPSRMTAELYRELMASDAYGRMAIDMVAEGPDGMLAAFCICWVDEEAEIAELEPVGTHPEYRRRGLAAAVCSAALTLAAERGAKTGVVFHDPGTPAERLYQEALRFEPAGVFRRWRVG